MHPGACCVFQACVESKAEGKVTYVFVIRPCASDLVVYGGWYFEVHAHQWLYYNSWPLLPLCLRHCSSYIGAKAHNLGVQLVAWTYWRLVVCSGLLLHGVLVFYMLGYLHSSCCVWSSFYGT